MTNISNAEFLRIHTGFIEELKKRSRSQSTVIAYAKDIEQLLNFISSRGIDTIRKVSLEDLDAFKQYLQQNRYTPKSISRKINSIRTFYKYMEDKGVIIENPAEKLTHPKFEVKPPRVLTQLEYRALRDVSRIDIRLYSIIELLLQTGIRIGELASLSIDDIRISPDAKVRYLYIRESGSHKSRTVPLNKPAQKAIDSYQEIRPECEEDTFFVTKNGKPLLVRNIRTTIDKAFEKSGIKNAKVNDLRNTFIAHHLMNGMSLVTVSKLVGHKRLSTTEKYLDLLKENKRDDDTTSLGDL